MKILVVEDEKKAATYLRKGLSENGFVVDVADQGDDGLHLAKSGDYDLVVLDVMLPGRTKPPRYSPLLKIPFKYMIAEWIFVTFATLWPSPRN